MKGQRFTYYLVIWLSLTAVYTAAVLLYYDIPVRPGLADAAIFSIILFGLGFSMWFAIRYMDLGIKSLPELSMAHLALCGLIIFTSIYITERVERVSMETMEVLPEGLLLAKIFMGLLLYAFVLMVFYFTRYRESLDRKEEKEEELKSLLNEAELNLLKSQLNPHFIFNSLNSISSLTITNPDRARNMVVKLSDFLRYTLGKGKDEMVALEEELNNVTLFLDIEKIRFGDRLNLESKVEPDTLNIQVPILILQPLIENAVKYAVYDSLEGASIQLTSQRKKQQLQITISNPFDPKDMAEKGKGIGINNVRQRLRLVYGDIADIGIQKTDNIFTCTVVLPVN